MVFFYPQMSMVPGICDNLVGGDAVERRLSPFERLLQIAHSRARGIFTWRVQASVFEGRVS